jgi:glutathione S-transferase
MLLYHTSGSRSSRVRWVLEEAGAPYELVWITPDERTQDEHRTRHPLGRVPVAEIDGTFVFENAALSLHVAENNPESGLLPDLGTVERALVYQWISFSLTEIEPPTLQVFRFRETDPARAADGKERFEAAAAVVEERLSDGRAFLTGDRFTLADIMLGSALMGAGRIGLTVGPFTQKYLDQLAERPARTVAYEPAS